MPKFNIFWLYAIILAVLLGIYMLNNESYTKEVDWTQFEKYVQKGGVSDIVVISNKGVAEGVLTDSIAKEVFPDYTKETSAQARIMTQIPSADKLEENIDKWREAGSFKGNVKYEKGSDFGGFLWSLWPILLLVAIWYIFMRRMSGGMGGGSGAGGVFSVGKSRAKLFDKDNSTRVTFNDVAGLQEAKTEVAEIVDFLKTPQKYTELGGKIPKGALLVGPPGTGKTLLAKAVAGEANVPFFSMSGSDFVEMFVGVGASRVRDLFRQAKEKAPCIVFIDEIDAVGRARGKNPNMGANDERENTLNQLLTEMDGFGTNSGVIVLAATNRVDILDKALLRAGRFDRQIHVDLPDLNERKSIFLVHMKPLKMDKTVDVDLMARQTPGFSGADIANVCNEAALIAARHDKPAVGMQDFLSAVDRIIGGLEKKTKVMTQDEKHTIALHEAGHATISWFLQYASPLVKVTIVPRGQALGAAWYLPEERNITTKEQMEDEICATLGGRAAEELFSGHISTGALNDLETVTKRAYGMVAYLGMSEKLYNLCYYNNQEYQFNKPYSEKTSETIDAEVRNLVNRQYERAKNLLLEHKEGHAALAKVLEEREVIFAEDVEKIFGKRPWLSRADEILQEEEKAVNANKENVPANEGNAAADEPEMQPAEKAASTTEENKPADENKASQNDGNNTEKQ